MFNRTSRQLCLALAITFATAIAAAHDPRYHEPVAPPPQAKAKPSTCAQLADTQHYFSDLTNADIKALKAKCDAEKAAANKAAPVAKKKS